MKKRVVSLVLALVLCLGLVPTAHAAKDLPFTDVPANAWYRADVAAACQTGLFTGVSATAFNPNGTLNLAQAVTLAARLHQYDREGKVTLSNGTKVWYTPFVDYAKANGIISNTYDGRWNEAATRAEMVQIFYKALPADRYTAVNQVEDNAIPDVKLSYSCGEAVYAFYRAGILTGSGSTYKNVPNGPNYFKPGDTVKRCEVAAILNRMLDPARRQSVTLALPAVPAYDAEVTDKNVLALLDNYDPDGAFLIRNADTYFTYTSLKDKTIRNFMVYIWNDSLMPADADLVHRAGSRLNTTVHEECHGFTDSTKFYIGDGEYVVVPRTQTFKTEEMSRLLPESLRTNRYDTYVKEGAAQTANQYGIYGLLDEFTAYYWGNHNTVVMYDYYKGCYGDYITSLPFEERYAARIAYGLHDDQYVSYAEFRFYILSYMLYAKENYPEIYRGILENDSFRLVFSTIDAKFASAVETIMSRPGCNTYYMDDYNRLMSVMERPEYVEMARLLQP